MRRILVLILALWMGGTVLGDELVSKNQFTSEAARMFRVKRPHFEVNVVGELEIQYRSADDTGGSPQHLYLDNAYKEYLSQPGQMRDILASYLRTADSSLEKHVCKAQDVVPVIKDAAYLEGVKRMLAKMEAEDPKVASVAKDSSLIAVPLVDDLFVIYAVDSPEAITFLSRNKLAECGIREEDIHKLAVDNLRLKATTFEAKSNPETPGIFIILGDDNYETALMALDDYWSPARFPFKGEIVVAAPARGFLLIADGADTSAVDRLSRIAHRLYKEKPYSLSPALFARHGDAWVHFHD